MFLDILNKFSSLFLEVHRSSSFNQLNFIKFI